MKSELADLIDRTVLYFEHGVLAPYRDASHHYEVVTDNFDGRVSIQPNYYESLSEEDRTSKNLDVRFGFRARRDGALCIAIWAPDIMERAGTEHRKKWAPFAVSSDAFPEALDTRFSLWAERTLAGSWDVEDGPLSRLTVTISEINALTDEAVDKPLFKAESSATLAFPNAENSRAYGLAHSAVYGLVIDGLDKGAMVSLAPKLGVSLKNRLDNDRPLTALKKILPDAVQLALEAPFGQVSKARGEADHGAQLPAVPLPAFDQFLAEIEGMIVGLIKLRDFLATALNLDAERCVQRRQQKRCLPEIDTARRPEPHYSIHQVRCIVGKTVESVEYGFKKPRAGVHDSEALILRFTDGSVLGINVGSNAANLSHTHQGLEPEDFHTDFRLDIVMPKSPSKVP